MTVEGNVPPMLPLTPTAEELALRQAVRTIAAKFGPNYFQRVADEGGQLTDLWKALADNGFVGVHLPEQYGGGGCGIYELAAIVEETAIAGCAPQAFIYSAGMAGPLITKHATPAVRDEWLPRLASGESIISFALTESDAGSNSHNIRTKAERQGDKYVINGAKQFITGVESADAIIVAARTGTNEETGRGRISLFLVDADAPGLTRTKIPTAIGMPEKSWSLFFDDVEVDASRLLGEENRGFRAIFDGLNAERVLVAAMTNGFAQYALTKAVNYAKQRVVWDAPIGSHQGVAHPLARIKVEIEHARLMTQKAAILLDAGYDAGESANMCKMMAAEAAIHSFDRAIHTHGGNGVTLEYQLVNYWFHVRLLKVAPVSEELVLSYIAQNTLGLPKSY
ncbi:acyl-CoA dehydrogenase family protein [Streptomyces sp. NPDC056227]|uniref:acyl-CoA dehydrogenase family protein n=1 Tax=Streptomyces sp. NPDC056227 TaxID=3345753 RepID=UPI0035D9CB47